MLQKLIEPFLFVRKEIYPGIEVRNDTAINVKAKFIIDYDLWKKSILNKVIIKLSHMDYRDLRRIKSLYGVSNNSPLESSGVEIVNIMVTDICVIIKNLTTMRNQFELLTHIKSNIKSLPKSVLEVIKHINSCNLTTHITGTEASLFNFTELNVNFTDKYIGSEHTHLPEFTLGKVHKLNEAMGLLSIEQIIDFNGLEDLFGESEHLFCINVKSNNKNDKLFQIAKDHTVDDLLHGLLCLPTYELTGTNIIRAHDVTITNGQINDILQVPIEMLSDPNINHVSTRKLTNDYINSKVPTRLGEEPIQKGMKKYKGFDDKFIQKFEKDRPTKKSKVQKSLDKLGEEGMVSEVEDNGKVEE